MSGHAGGTGRQRSSAASTRARAAARNAASGSAVTTSTALGILGGQRRRRGFQLAALVQDLDAAFGLLELRMAEARELDAALVQRERLLEREVALFELLDDRFELGDRRFEVLDGWVGHSAFVTLASIAPRLKVTWIVSPGATVDASRRTRVWSAFQATAYPRPR